MGLVQLVVEYAIPDMPRKLSDRIQREDYLVSEFIIEQEKQPMTYIAGPPNEPCTADIELRVCNGFCKDVVNDCREHDTQM